MLEGMRTGPAYLVHEAGGFHCPIGTEGLEDSWEATVFSSHCKAKEGYSEDRREGPEREQCYFPLGLHFWARGRRCYPL